MNKMLLLTLLTTAVSASAQVAYTPPGNVYGPFDPRRSKPPNPGDVDYRTFVFNSRRYGETYFSNDPRYPNQYQGGFPQKPVYNPADGTFRYPNPNLQPAVPMPGVLGGWRPDLQGKQRPDYIQLQSSRDIYVTTSYGEVQGFIVHLYDDPSPFSLYRPGLTPVDSIKGNVSAFLGIPYALPPINEGRFKPPRTNNGWKLMQAVDFGPACPQPAKYVGYDRGVRDMDEDCLYLNIYSPNTASGMAHKYPVMFYIHGGEFYRGASNLFPAHVMAGFYDVVVVTINYRLGALGFLSTADANSPGNYGILDQAMALKWVYDNIEFFNGDREAITVFGPGAGAASAGLLMVAPRTRHMVNKVIAQSGSALADWALIQNWERVQNTSKVFGRHLGCSVDSSWKLINCLTQGRSFFEIGNVEFRPEVGLFPWGPVLDKNFTVPSDSWYKGMWSIKDWTFMPATPEELIVRKQMNQNLRYMSGVTMQEAAYLIYRNQSLAPLFEVPDTFFTQKVRELVLQYNYTLNQEGVYQAIKYMYTYWPDPRNITHIREQYIHMMSDMLYRAPSDKITKMLINQKVPVYMYVLNTTVEALKLPEWRKVPHDTELLFLTGAPFMDTEFFPKEWNFQRTMWTEGDRNMSHFFMKAYTDFAKYGNPSQQQILGLHFEMATQGQLRYLNVNTTLNSSILVNYRQTESAFWSEYLPTVIGAFFPIYRPYNQYWWEPREPLQIAFWSISAVCLILLLAIVMACILYINAKRSPGRYYSDELIRKDDLELDGGLENASSSTGNMYQGTPVSKRPSGTPPPAFRTRPSNLSLAQQQQPVQKSKSTASFLGKIAMDPDPNQHQLPSGRSYSTPSLRSNGSEDSVRMVPGKQKAVRRQVATRIEKVPQTQV